MIAFKLAADLLTSQLRAMRRASLPGKYRLQEQLMKLHRGQGIKSWPTASHIVGDPSEIRQLGRMPKGQEGVPAFRSQVAAELNLARKSPTSLETRAFDARARRRNTASDLR